MLPHPVFVLYLSYYKFLCLKKQRVCRTPPPRYLESICSVCYDKSLYLIKYQQDSTPTPAPRNIPAGFTMPDLPSVPDLPEEKNSPQDDEIDFDDLDKRFQQLKKK